MPVLSPSSAWRLEVWHRFLWLIGLMLWAATVVMLISIEGWLLELYRPEWFRRSIPSRIIRNGFDWIGSWGGAVIIGLIVLAVASIIRRQQLRERAAQATPGQAAPPATTQILDPTRMTVAYATAVLVALIPVYAFKAFVPRVRPRQFTGDDAWHSFLYSGQAPLQWEFAGDHWGSFPSAHTATAFALALAIYYIWPKRWLAGVMLMAATLTASSRVLGLAHYLSDIVAGAGFGIIGARVGLAVAEAKWEQWRAWGVAQPAVWRRSNQRVRSFFSRGRADWLMLMLMFGFAYLVGNGSISLWERDEAGFAARSLTMLLNEDARGWQNWLVPKIFDDYYFNKPVLMFWLNAAAYSVFGADNFAARLVAALGGVGAVLVTYHFARDLAERRPHAFRLDQPRPSTSVPLSTAGVPASMSAEDSTGRADRPLPDGRGSSAHGVGSLAGEADAYSARYVALAAALMLGASLGMLLLSKWGTTDAPLLFLTVLTQWLLFRCFFVPATSGEKWGRMAALGFVLGTSFMLKGPANLVAIGPQIVLTLVLLRPWTTIGRWPFWLATVAILSAIVLPYQVALAQYSDGEATQQMFLQQIVRRLVVPDNGHWGIPGYYLITLAVATFPWTLMVGWALGRALLDWLNAWPTRAASTSRDREGAVAGVATGVPAGLVGSDAGLGEVERERGVDSPDRWLTVATRRSVAARWPSAIWNWIVAKLNAARVAAYAQPVNTFLLAGIVPGWVALELIVTKLPHYSAPLWPMVAILTARMLVSAQSWELTTFVRRHPRLVPRTVQIMRWAAWVVFFIAVGFGAAAHATLGMTMWSAVACGMLILVCQLLVQGLMRESYRTIEHRQVRPTLVAEVGLVVVFIPVLITSALSLLERYRVEPALAVAIRQGRAMPTMPTVITGWKSNSVVFYVGRDLDHVALRSRPVEGQRRRASLELLEDWLVKHAGREVLVVLTSEAVDLINQDQAFRQRWPALASAAQQPATVRGIDHAAPEAGTLGTRQFRLVTITP